MPWLKHKKTGEIFPFNEYLAKHSEMILVEDLTGEFERPETPPPEPEQPVPVYVVEDKKVTVRAPTKPRAKTQPKAKPEPKPIVDEFDADEFFTDVGMV
jgi:hypothetical protein